MLENYLNDIVYEVWPSRNQGGQYVRTPSGIKATHTPTNTTAIVDCGRSQHINKMIAQDMILTALTHPKFR